MLRTMPRRSKTEHLPFITVTQAARLLGVSNAEVRRRCNRDELLCRRKPNGYRKVDRASVDRLLERERAREAEALVADAQDRVRTTAEVIGSNGLGAAADSIDRTRQLLEALGAAAAELGPRERAMFIAALVAEARRLAQPITEDTMDAALIDFHRAGGLVALATAAADAARALGDASTETERLKEQLRELSTTLAARRGEHA
jgi:AraC-like DNA-binding protein